MNAERAVLADGAVAIAGDRIVAVGTAGDLLAAHPAAEVRGGPGTIVMPGLVNAHQHLTGDRLLRSMIPDAIDSDEAIFGWAVPLHTAHRGDDDELSATIGLVDAAQHGVTFTVEAGTVAHPERIAAAYAAVGVAGTLGTWGSDTAGLPYAGDVAAVVDRQLAVLELAAHNPLLRPAATLVGHDLMSDALIAAVSELTRERGALLTFHLSPSAGDGASYLARTGRRPLVHLDSLGVLGRHILLAHGVHLDDDELDVVVARDVAVATCPWAYLRLGQGVSTAGRHHELIARGARLAVGCDAENAGDRVDVLGAAALAVGLGRDRTGDVHGLTAATALELATIGGAAAVGLAAEIGSLEVGKRADVVVVDPSRRGLIPAGDPLLTLVWAGGGEAVRDVVVAGRSIVADGRCTTVDVESLAVRAAAAQQRLIAETGITPRSPWPIVR